MTAKSWAPMTSENALGPVGCQMERENRLGTNQRKPARPPQRLRHAWGEEKPKNGCKLSKPMLPRGTPKLTPGGRSQ